MIEQKSDEPLFNEMVMVLPYYNKTETEVLLQEIKDCITGKVKKMPGQKPPLNISDALHRVCKDKRIPKAVLQKRLENFRASVENYLRLL